MKLTLSWPGRSVSEQAVCTRQICPVHMWAPFPAGWGRDFTLTRAALQHLACCGLASGQLKIQPEELTSICTHGLTRLRVQFEVKAKTILFF